MKLPQAGVRGRVVLAVMSCVFVLPAAGLAQARVLVSPSAAAGVVFDDNLFSTPDTQALSDGILRVTPGLSASRETSRAYWFGAYSFDAERYQEHATLTTPMARQSASALTRFERSPRTTFLLEGNYDSTITPNELNVSTGLFATRDRAWRLSGAPEVRHELTALTAIDLRYAVSTDSLLDERIVTHAADITLAHKFGTRNELRLEPFGREFLFNDARLAAGGVTAGWIHRFTPFTSVRLQAGPRFVERTKTARPEVDLLLQRRTEYSELSLAYTRTMTTAVGVRQVVDTQRVLARAAYRHPAVVDVMLEGGFFVDKFSATTRVYRLGADVTRAFAPALAISLSYSLDWQRNPFAGVPTPIPGDILGGQFGLPDVLLAPTPISSSLRKNVVAVRLVVAPTIKPTRRPPDTPAGSGPTLGEGPQ